jgi:hypothetical protein
LTEEFSEVRIAAMSTHDNGKAPSKAAPPECFVIMPISDPDSYPKGHFRRVYEDLIKPACATAGFDPIRADDIRETNLIHLDVLQKLIDSPMAICDLSTRNPNVLFELGLRQAFDKPVALIQEVGTQKIFDITPLRYTEYRKERVYHEVIEDQQSISRALIATRDAKKDSINSIVRLLSITKPAALSELSDANKDPMLQIVRAELNELRQEIRRSRNIAVSGSVIDTVYSRESVLGFEGGGVRKRMEAIESQIKGAKHPAQLHGALATIEANMKALYSIPDESGQKSLFLMQLAALHEQAGLRLD